MNRIRFSTVGGIIESYPGKGRAVFVEVLPTYQPESADLTEAETVKRALEGIDSKEFAVPAIRSVTYNSKQDSWTVTFKSGDLEAEKTVKDDKN